MIGFKVMTRICLTRQFSQCALGMAERRLSSSKFLTPLGHKRKAEQFWPRPSVAYTAAVTPTSWMGHSIPSQQMSTQPPEGGQEEKLGLFKKFKKMWKDYWYVMIPVHLVTSAGWLGGFYVMCKSGLDVPAILAAMGTSEAYLEKISQSQYTYIALSYACYKVATPARYTVTIGGTTLAIRRLQAMGMLKTTNQLAAKGKTLAAQGKTSAKLTWDKLAKKRK